MSIAQIADKVREYNAGEVSLKVLWDFREGRVPDIPNDLLKLGARNMANDIQELPGRRVALVTNQQFDFGVIRVWNAFSESLLDIEQKAFYDFDAALDWLDS